MESTMVMIDNAGASPSKGQAWFRTTDSPSDIVVQVEGMIFHLHKHPLMSKSSTLHDLILEQEAAKTPRPPPSTVQGENDTEQEDNHDQSYQCHVSFSLFPGGSDTFETAMKFCYGPKINLTATNIAALRCAGDVLRMTEEHAEHNLIAATENYLANNIFSNISDSIKVLKSCEKLCPVAENLGIVQTCIDSIVSKLGPNDPWVADDLTKLGSEFFNRVIHAMKDTEIEPEIIESCLMQYAKRRFPGISRWSRRTTPISSPLSIASEAEQRKLLESLVSNLSSENNSQSPAKTRFLFGLLRTANILNASDECKFTLERKISAKLENAILDDLLIPSYSYLSETLYDVDCVQRMVHSFLEKHKIEIENDCDDLESVTDVKSPALMLVGKLMDGYLSEIASDANLNPDKFYELAVSLPEGARAYDDGIYRAVDVYLKAHPWITEAEREKISGVMSCQKLTLEACTHAAQNERLPLRMVIQVLFFEQLQLRHAIAGTMIAPLDFDRQSTLKSATKATENASIDDISSMVGESISSRSSKLREAMRENQVLRLDMDNMRSRVKELEKECSYMKMAIEKFDKVEKTRNGTSWRSKFGCKFTTKVCNSHESAVVDERRTKHRGSRW